MRILIAEDEPVSAKLLSSIVSEFGETDITANGAAALAAYSRGIREDRPYDLILLDIMMPEVDGQEVLQEIREMEQESGVSEDRRVKVIMVTALDDGANIYRAHASDCLDYLTKPINRERIVTILRRLNLLDRATA